MFREDVVVVYFVEEGRGGGGGGNRGKLGEQEGGVRLFCLGYDRTMLGRVSTRLPHVLARGSSGAIVGENIIAMLGQDVAQKREVLLV